jgi:hypothetical protein
MLLLRLRYRVDVCFYVYVNIVSDIYHVGVVHSSGSGKLGSVGKRVS